MISVNDKKTSFYFIKELLNSYNIVYYSGDFTLIFKLFDRSIKIVENDDYSIYIDGIYTQTFMTEWGVVEKFLKPVLERYKKALDNTKKA